MLGWTLDPAFSDEDSAYFILSEAIYLMLSSREKFPATSARPMVLPSDGVTSLLDLSCGKRAEVDLMTEAAVAAAGVRAPEDLDFMYSRAFEDPDRNGFGPFGMRSKMDLTETVSGGNVCLTGFPR